MAFWPTVAALAVEQLLSHCDLSQLGLSQLDSSATGAATVSAWAAAFLEAQLVSHQLAFVAETTAAFAGAAAWAGHALDWPGQAASWATAGEATKPSSSTEAAMTWMISFMMV